MGRLLRILFVFGLVGLTVVVVTFAIWYFPWWKIGVVKSSGLNIPVKANRWKIAAVYASLGAWKNGLYVSSSGSGKMKFAVPREIVFHFGNGNYVRDRFIDKKTGTVLYSVQEEMGSDGVLNVNVGLVKPDFYEGFDLNNVVNFQMLLTAIRLTHSITKPGEMSLLIDNATRKIPKIIRLMVNLDSER